MIHVETLEALKARFPHFDPEACAPLFADDQEEKGLFPIEGQGSFPGVRMENGSIWFYDPEHRPRRHNRAGDDIGPMKTRAPFGERRLLCSDRSATEMLFVEGEGHLVALVSIGVRGVVACGGVNVFQSQAGWAVEELRNLVTGKRVRLAFDFDQAGQRASGEVMRRLLECGATRVAALPPQEDWQQGWDVEDWLASFDSAAAAYGELMRRIGSLEWLDAAAQAEADDAEQALPEHHVRTERIPLEAEDLPAVVVTIYDEEAKRLDLAVIGPASDVPEEEHDSVRHDAEPESEESGLSNGWRVIEAWLHDGERYIPDERGAMLSNIQRGTMVLPAPPAEEYGTSESLWGEVKDFVRGWLALRDADYYDILAAYAFMSYRLFDAQFPYVPYLRFHGPSGTGKGRALSVMKSLCCWSLDGQPSSDNLHRIVEYYGEITLCIDEFHLDRGLSREAMERIIDTLNLGNDLQKVKLRCDNTHEGMVVNAYHLFGPKIFAGYGYDEHESLARRTVNIDMAGVDVPLAMDIFALPPRFYKDAYQIRRKLMAWRGAKYGLGLPDPEGDRARRLHKQAGREVGQIFWPLLEMVPNGMPEAEEAVLKAAVLRRENTKATRGVADESFMLENGFTNRTELAYSDGRGSLFFPTNEAAEAIDLGTAFFARQMKRIGLQHIRRRLGDRADSNPVGGFLLNGSVKEIAIFDRYGVTHPSLVATTNQEGAL